MPNMMKVARLFAPLDLRLISMPIPELGPNDVLCKVHRACICGTDLAIYSGECSFVRNGEVDFPMTQGHEWSGVVAAIGSAVSRFKAGDRVVSDNGVACGKCSACLCGDLSKCRQVRSLGTVHAWDGAFAEYFVMPERSVFHLPDAISFDEGALMEPATIAYSGIRSAEVNPGDAVLVNGSGSIGMIAVRLAKLAGASKVFMTGRKEFKLNKAKEFGADVTIDTTRESVFDVLARETPAGKVDRIIETSGSIQLLKDSLRQVVSGGIIAAVAFYEKNIPELPIDQLVFGNVTLRGVADSSRTHQPVLRLMESGRLRMSSLITGRYRFADILQAYRDMTGNNDTRIKLILDFEV